MVLCRFDGAEVAPLPGRVGWRGGRGRGPAVVVVTRRGRSADMARRRRLFGTRLHDSVYREGQFVLGDRRGGGDWGGAQHAAPRGGRGRQRGARYGRRGRRPHGRAARGPAGRGAGGRGRGGGAGRPGEREAGRRADRHGEAGGGGRGDGRSHHG